MSGVMNVGQSIICKATLISCHKITFQERLLDEIRTCDDDSGRKVTECEYLLQADRKAIFVVVIIIQCATRHDGHAGLEMGSPSSPLLKPFRGLLPSYCPTGEQPFAISCLSIINEQRK